MGGGAYLEEGVSKGHQKGKNLGTPEKEKPVDSLWRQIDVCARRKGPIIYAETHGCKRRPNELKLKSDESHSWRLKRSAKRRIKRPAMDLGCPRHGAFRVFSRRNDIKPMVSLEAALQLQLPASAAKTPKLCKRTADTGARLYRSWYPDLFGGVQGKAERKPMPVWPDTLI